MCATIALPAHAADRVTFVTRITEDGRTDVETEIATVDGDRARIDLLGTQKKVTARTPYMLTVDGGANWVLADDNDAFCTELETEKFFREVGSSLRRLGRLVVLKAPSPELTKVFENPGPEMLGHSTTHVRLESTLGASARVAIKKYEYTVKISEDIWYSTDLVMHPIRRKWLVAATQSGIPVFDELTDKWIAQVQGAVVKQTVVLELTDVVKEEKTITREETEVTDIEHLERAQLPENVFEVPDCTDDKSSVTDAAKKLLDMSQMKP
jgi:hypothetical protein